jgi:hypothetical protein
MVISATSSVMTSSPIYHPPSPDIEARSRLVSLLSVCEHELASLEALGDARLAAIIEHMRSFHQALVVALTSLPLEPDSAA